MQHAQELLVKGMEFDRPEWVREAFAQGVDVKGSVQLHPDDPPQPLLIFAASRDLDGHVVRDLVKAGADVNVRDREGRTALHHIAGRGLQLLRYCEVARVLLELGIDPNAKDLADRTALDAAVDITTRLSARPRAERNAECPDLLVSRFLIELLEANGAMTTSASRKLALSELRRQAGEELAVRGRGFQR
jgi:hypothetical protein